MANEEFFVNITEPVSVRKNLLEGSKNAIHMLQDYEKLKSIRKEKTEQIAELDSIMKEIVSLSTKLKSSMPKVPKAAKSSTPKKKKTTKKGTKEPEKPKKTPFDELQEELNTVEQALNNLDG